jgi:hypothetical protein
MSMAELEREIGGKVQGLERLSKSDADRLLKQVREARQRQEKELAKIFKDTLDHLPLLLRVPVRKLFEKS